MATWFYVETALVILVGGHSEVLMQSKIQLSKAHTHPDGADSIKSNTRVLALSGKKQDDAKHH
jgi:hypothetical protein